MKGHINFQTIESILKLKSLRRIYDTYINFQTIESILKQL